MGLYLPFNLATLLCMFHSRTCHISCFFFCFFFSMIWGERWLFVLVNCWQSLLNLLFVIILYILISIKTFAHALNQISAHIGKSQCHRLTYMTYFMWQCCRHEYTCSWCTVHLTFNNNQSIKYFQLFSLYIVILL